MAETDKERIEQLLKSINKDFPERIELGKRLGEVYKIMAMDELELLTLDQYQGQNMDYVLQQLQREGLELGDKVSALDKEIKKKYNVSVVDLQSDLALLNQFDVSNMADLPSEIRNGMTITPRNEIPQADYYNKVFDEIVEQNPIDEPDITLNPDGSTTERFPGGEINRDVPLEEFGIVFGGSPYETALPDMMDVIKDTIPYKRAQFHIYSFNLEYQDRLKFKELIDTQYDIFFNFVKDTENITPKQIEELLKEVNERVLILDEKYKDITVKKDVDLSLEELTTFDNAIDDVNTNFKSKLEAALDNIKLDLPNNLNRDVRQLEIADLNLSDDYKQYFDEIIKDTKVRPTESQLRLLDDVLNTEGGKNAVETMLINLRNGVTKHGAYSLDNLMKDYGADNLQIMGAKQEIAELYFNSLDEILESHLNQYALDPDIEMKMQFDFAESKLRELGISDIEIDNIKKTNEFFLTGNERLNASFDAIVSNIDNVNDVIKNKGTINEWFDEAYNKYDLVSGPLDSNKRLLKYSDLKDFLINEKGLSTELTDKLIQDIKDGVFAPEFPDAPNPKNRGILDLDAAKNAGFTDVGISRNLFMMGAMQQHLDNIYTPDLPEGATAVSELSYTDRQPLQDNFYKSLKESDDIVEIYLRQVSRVNVPAESVYFRPELVQEVPGFYTEPIGGLSPGDMASGGGIKPTENYYRLEVNKNNLLINVPGFDFQNELKTKLDWNLLEKELGIKYSQFKDINSYQLFHTKLSNVAQDLGIDNTKLYSTLRKSGYEGTVGYVNRQVEVVLLDPNDDLGIGQRVNFENSTADAFYNNKQTVNQLDELVIKPKNAADNVLDFREAQLKKIMEEVEEYTPDVKKITPSQAELIDNALADAAAKLSRSQFNVIEGGIGRQYTARQILKVAGQKLGKLFVDGITLVDIYELGLIAYALGEPAVELITKLIYPDLKTESPTYGQQVMENFEVITKISPTDRLLMKAADEIEEQFGFRPGDISEEITRVDTSPVRPVLYSPDSDRTVPVEFFTPPSIYEKTKERFQPATLEEKTGYEEYNQFLNGMRGMIGGNNGEK